MKLLDVNLFLPLLLYLLPKNAFVFFDCCLNCLMMVVACWPFALKRQLFFDLAMASGSISTYSSKPGLQLHLAIIFCEKVCLNEFGTLFIHFGWEIRSDGGAVSKFCLVWFNFDSLWSFDAEKCRTFLLFTSFSSFWTNFLSSELFEVSYMALSIFYKFVSCEKVLYYAVWVFFK